MTKTVKIKSKLFKPYLLDLLEFYKSDLKYYQFDAEPALPFYAAVFLYTYKFDQLLGYNCSNKSKTQKTSEEILFELKNKKTEINLVTNLVLNESIQFNLQKISG
jgi:hypothetical protein